MVKNIIAIILLFTLGFVNAQTNAIFPVVAKRGMKTGGISLNGQYAFISNASYATSPINISIYDIISRKPIKNLNFNPEKGMSTLNISNDGRYILMDDSDGYGYNFVYDVVSNELTEKKPSSEFYNLYIGLQEIHKAFFPNDDKYYHYDYWFSHHYAIRTEKGSLIVYDSIHKQTSKYDLDKFEGLKNNDKNELALSENGNVIAYNTKSDIYVYEIKSQKLILHQELEITGIGQLTISNDGVICILGFYNEDKDIGLHWYNSKSGKYLCNSTKDGLLNLTYVSQFNNYMTVGFGSEDKKKVQQTQFIDLCSGEFSAIVNGAGWSSFNHVQKFVKDTLSRSLLNKEQFDYVNGSRVYPNYFLMKSDYYNKSEEYEPQTSNPQVSENFFDFIDGKNWNIEILTAHENRVTFQNTTGNLDFFGLILKKKMVYFWNGKKEKPEERLVKLFITEDLKPVFYCDDNYYYCPSGMSNVIGFEQDFKYYPAEQFDLKYNRPDIILDRLGYADSLMVAAYYQAYKKRLKKIGFTEEMLEDDFHLPEIDIENLEEIPTLNNLDSVQLNLNSKDSKYKLDRINVWVNDVAIYGNEGISLRKKNIHEYQGQLNVFLARGKNKIQVSALNQAGAESYKETFEIECTAGKTLPDLYLITIGESEFQQSDFNLNYAAKDAKDIASLLTNSKVYNNVNVKTLINEQVTKENVIGLKSFLNQADINDHVVVFVAGHGILSSDLDYYLATYDMDFSQPEIRGLAYADLEGLMDGIKALKKTLIIDACNSGEIDKEAMELVVNEQIETGDIQFRTIGSKVKAKLGYQNTMELSKSLFTDLRKGTGTTVISSAGGMEFAMEGEDWKNGLFTYCFIQGIKSKEADLNKDGKIQLSELQEYVSRQVYKLSKGRQQPTSRIENQTIDFRIW